MPASMCMSLRESVQEPHEFQISSSRAEEFWKPIFGGEESIKKSGPTKLVFFEYVLN